MQLAEPQDKHQSGLYSFTQRKISFQIFLIALLIIKGIKRVKNKHVCSLSAESVDSGIHAFWFVIRVTLKVGKVIFHFIEACVWITCAG